MRIQSSHLALRFYVMDGWTYDDVKKYCIQGNIEKVLCINAEIADSTDKQILDLNADEMVDYYRPTIDAVMDCKAMLRDGHEVVRWYEGRLEQVTDLEYLEGFNKGEKNGT